MKINNMKTQASTPKTPAWQFDEFQDFGWSDTAAIEAYDRKARVDPALERERLLQLGIRPEHTTLEFGPGTGALTMEAARLCDQVIAVDTSRAMLEYARSKAKTLGIDNIDYVHAGFLSYEHTGGPVDLVVTQRTLHHLPDFWKVQALEGIARALKPGGVLYLRDLAYSFEPGDAEEAIEAWIGAVAVDSADGFPREFFEKDVREEFITYTWLLELMLEKVGFEIRDAWYSEWKAYVAYTCVKR